jgi:hypothetical protein
MGTVRRVASQHPHCRLTLASAASGSTSTSRGDDEWSARQQQASLGRRHPDVASEESVAQCDGDGLRADLANARRSTVFEREWQTRSRRRVACPVVRHRPRTRPSRCRDDGRGQHRTAPPRPAVERISRRRQQPFSPRARARHVLPTPRLNFLSRLRRPRMNAPCASTPS